MGLRTVYRIEDVAGCGPFRGGHIREARDAAYGGNSWRHDPYNMPCPHDRGQEDIAILLRRNSGEDGMGHPYMVFGFPSKAALRAYFKPALLRRLGAQGYRIAAYRVRDDDDALAVSHSQALFNRRAAYLHREQPCK